jgi:3'(2'), 5'-bisphosphate nucleotidase
MINWQPSTLLKLGIQAALAAGECIESFQRIGYTTLQKPDGSPVTEADIAADGVICNYLIKSKFPIISEEQAIVPYSERKLWSRLWLVDPLDGTKAFIKKYPDYAVNIALIEHGAPCLGILYFPATRLMYFAERHCGAYYLKIPQLIEPLDVLLHYACRIENKLLPRVYTVACSRSAFGAHEAQYIDELKFKLGDVNTLIAGGSLKQAYVAEHRVHEYPRFGKTMEWDTAAGQCIIEENGGAILNWETKAPLRYNTESLINPHFVAFAKISS